MECRNCPYSEEDFNRMIACDTPDEFEQSLWCDKVGGKVYHFGYCTDAYSDIPKRKNHSKKKEKK